MIDAISVENMRLSDQYTIANLIPSLELMGRAAEGVFRAVKWDGSIAILAGSGNNGGDGFALACILKDHGFDCAVFTVSQRLSGDSAYYAEKAAAKNVPIQPFYPGCLHGYQMIVDCLLGTGFQGTLREHYRSVIEAINASGVYVVSVDINSGMNGDTGEAEAAVHSDLTVTIGYVKDGLLTPNAGEHMKRLVCTDIGIVPVREENKICTEQEWLALCQSHGISQDQTFAVLDGTVYYRCPSWLDMEVIPVVS